MTRAPDRTARPPLVGLVVNPIAGLGGSVGLKGTDGPDVVTRALALGAVPHATDRAATALRSLATAWGAHRPDGQPPVLLTGAGGLGADATRAAGVAATVVDTHPDDPTTARDTQRLVERLVTSGVDLLLFAGGDGTARDVHGGGIGRRPVLGIPAGVKVHSAVFATSPTAAGALAAEHLAASAGPLVEREVVDLDEDAVRRGVVAPRLFGTLWVPEGRRLQPRKSPAAAGDAAAAEGIADELAARIGSDGLFILGPGTTTQAVGRRLGIEATLVGVDLVGSSPEGPRLLVADATEEDLLARLVPGRTWVVVTPIGGQGFILGRGNQQVSSRVLARVGGDRVIVVATPGKLASLGGRPLLVDTGDRALDRALSGHIRVVTGRGDTAIVPVEEA